MLWCNVAQYETEFLLLPLFSYNRNQVFYWETIWMKKGIILPSDLIQYLLEKWNQFLLQKSDDTHPLSGIVTNPIMRS